MGNRRLFSTEDLARLSGTVATSVVAWRRAGLLVPIHALGPRKLRYTIQQAFAATLGVYLRRQHGISAPAFAKVIRFLGRCNLEQRLADGERFLVMLADQVFAARPEAVFKRDGSDPVAVTRVDLKLAWEKFQAHLEKDRNRGATNFALN
jgi:hypothetical protein